MLFFAAVSAFMLRHLSSEYYLGMVQDQVVMTSDFKSAFDINMLKPQDSSALKTIFSLGVSALYMNDKNELKIKNIDLKDSKQFFVIVLGPDGSFIIKHEDKCLGIMPGKETHGVIGVDCEDKDKLLKLARTDYMKYNLDKIIPSSLEGKLNGERTKEIHVKVRQELPHNGFVGNNPTHAI